MTIESARIAATNAPSSVSASTTLSVSRAMALLDALGRAGSAQTLTHLSDATGLSKSTALRLLHTLQHSGMVIRDGSLYSVGHRLCEIALTRDDQMPTIRESVREAAVPFLQELYENSRETVNLAVLSGTEALLLDRVFGYRRVASSARIAGRLSGTNSALGKVLLAHSDGRRVHQAVSEHVRRTRHSVRSPHALFRELREAKDAGIAFDHQESSLGVSCAAAPIFLGSECIAAISVSGATERMDVTIAAGIVSRAASNISKALGAQLASEETRREPA